MRKQILSLALLTLALNLTACTRQEPKVGGQSENTIHDTPSQDGQGIRGAFLDIKEVLSERDLPESFKTRAYVIGMYSCPPCERPGLCAPCPDDSFLMINDVASPDSPKQVKVYFETPEQLKIGTLYDLSITLKPNRHNPGFKRIHLEFYQETLLEE